MTRSLMTKLFTDTVSLEASGDGLTKEEFYIEALKAGSYRKKVWVIRGFSVVRSKQDQEPIPYDIRYNRDSTEVYFPFGDEWHWVSIKDAIPFEPLFMPADPITVTPAVIPNCKREVASTYGDLLFNWIVLVEPFGDRIEYRVGGPLSISDVEREIANLLVDDEDISGIKPEPHQITIQMYMYYGRCMGSLAGYTQIFVPTLTAKAMTTDPRVREKRAELLELYKDRLFDPVVQAKIQDELIAMDREWIKGDPSEGFLLSNKTFGTARKRMFLIHGPEAGFDEGGNADLVVNSLTEGWDMEKMIPMFNSTRAGSFFRGALTALGGEAVKFFMRVFQNVTIIEDDCGSKLGVARYVAPGTGNYYKGLWEIEGNGLRLIDEERAKSSEGKTIVTRSPLYCKSGRGDLCAKCVGVALASNPKAIAAEVTAVASQFMDIMMASAHAKELKTATLDFESAFT